MKRLFIIMYSAVVISCGLTEVGKGERTESDGVWKGPEVPIAEKEEISVCYISAVSFPNGFKWKNTDKDNQAVIALYADGTPVLKIPVGNDYEVSADLDMHKVSEGHLYTCFYTSEETVLKKDGNELCRYPRLETIEEMESLDGSLYTLGPKKENGGFVFRKDGEIIIEKDRGKFYNSLRKDGDTLRFTFCDTVISTNGTECRYYTCANGKISRLPISNGVEHVCDLIVQGKQCFYVAYLKGHRPPVFFSGEKYYPLEMEPYSLTMLNCRLFLSETCDVCIESLFRYNNEEPFTIFWREEDIYCVYPSGKTTAAYYGLGNSIISILNPFQEPGVIYKKYKTYTLPEEYYAADFDVIAVSDTNVCIGLSSKEMKKPILLKNRQIDSLNMNGYITGVSFFP